jgi:general stress protein 26
LKVLSVEGLLSVVRATVEQAEYGFFVTLNASGAPDVRLMQHFPPEEDLSVCLGTSRGSRKVGEVRNDGRSALAFQDPVETAYTALYGLARVRDDASAKERYWREEWSAFWPAGPGAEDYVLIEFVPHRIELMNLSRDIAPDPYGLRAVTLIRKGDRWEPAEG